MVGYFGLVCCGWDFWSYVVGFPFVSVCLVVFVCYYRLLFACFLGVCFVIVYVSVVLR